MTKNAPSPILLTVKEVSLLLRIHRPKVYDLIREGVIEGFKLGSDWRVKRDSIEKLIGEIPMAFFEETKASADQDVDEYAPAGRKVRAA